MTSPFGPPHRKHRLATLLFSTSCLLGCFGRVSGDGAGGGESVGSSGGASSFEQPDVVCQRPDGAYCYEGTTCDAYTGYAIDEAAGCYDATPMTFWVCVPPNTGCGGAPSLGRNSRGQLWHFENTCVPPLFKEKGFSPYQPCTTSGLGGYGGLGDSQ